MMAISLITIPFLLGLACLVSRNAILRRLLVLAGAAVHLALTTIAWFGPYITAGNEWFALDHTGIIFLSVTSLLFCGASIYGMCYLADEERRHKRRKERSFFSREAVFCGCLLLFLSTMTAVITSQHLAVLWVGIEATTLASAPLIYFHRTKRSLEATWKYLLICSVGIAVALLGIFFLAVACDTRGDLILGKILNNAASMNIPWLKAAFLLLFVGYGTKMGLAPFHTWLPDAHSEAPSVVSALLSGGLLNCAFLGLLRVYQVCIGAGLMSYCQDIFIVFGLLSILFAAIFILGQKDHKRMLAYSSVEHMGIMTLGLGLGGAAVFGSMINMLGHSLTKAGLFFVAGNILSYFKTKNIPDIHGLIGGKTRRTGILWMLGFLLITGTPPSAIFLGKFMILKEALFQGRYWITASFLALLAIVFIGMARIFISMSSGVPDKDKGDALPEGNISSWRIYIPALFLVLVICLGIYFPDWLARALKISSKAFGGL
ncbi:MAG: proton-conducting transporter membrane subunit [Candidatus Omnitrophica bacterium]|nr:proton-conducting transporter membrane subunit [Candidatus Omnitrophota bacterium]MDD5488900.1 proton-conducting transporter membrane subunit [Candidatus Omnitrophota bacterium]